MSNMRYANAYSWVNASITRTYYIVAKHKIELFFNSQFVFLKFFKIKILFWNICIIDFHVFYKWRDIFFVTFVRMHFWIHFARTICTFQTFLIKWLLISTFESWTLMLKRYIYQTSYTNQKFVQNWLNLSHL